MDDADGMDGADGMESASTVAFVATGRAGDDEMTDRIAAHRRERDPGWVTVESPLDLVNGVRVALNAGRRSMVVVDCLSFWVANRLMECAPGLSGWAAVERELCREVDVVAGLLRDHSAPTVVVTNEVGSGLVPDSPLGRQFRDTLGRINARVSLAADEAFLVVAGRVLILEKPR